MAAGIIDPTKVSQSATLEKQLVVFSKDSDIFFFRPLVLHVVDHKKGS